MSADKYDNHILQKYCIGTAIAILRSRPEGISTENYISSLREKITVTRNDLDTNNDDSDVCSNDFQFSDDENIVGAEEYDNTLSNIDDLDKINVEIGNNNAYFANSHNRNHKNDTNIDFQNDNNPIRPIENIYRCLDNATNKVLLDTRVIESSTKTDGLKTTNDDVHQSKDIMAQKTTDVDPINAIMTVDDKLLLFNDDVLSLNDSITILENFDVNMAEGTQSLTEVLSVLRDINQNKIEKDFIDLTQSQIESAQIKNRNNDYKPKEDNIKNKSVQNIAKRIRKNIEKDDSSQLKNKTFGFNTKINESTVNKDTVRYNAKDAHKTAENMNEIDKTTLVNDTIKIVDNNDKCFSKNFCESNLMTKSSRDEIAAKVLKNINTNIKTSTKIHDQKTEIIQEPINKTTTESINNIVTSTQNTFVKRMKTQTDFDVTNSNDPEINYQNKLFKTQNYNQNDVIANKILNNIKKQNFDNNNNIENNNLNTNNNILDNNVDSQDTILYSLQGFTQNYTHVSQSQTEEIIISDKFIHGNKAICQFEENVRHDKRLTCIEVNIPHEEQSRTHMDGPNTDLNIQNTRPNTNTSNAEENQIPSVNANNIQYVVDKNGKMFKVLTGNADKINTGFEINKAIEISNNIVNNIFDKGIENKITTQAMNNFDDIFENPSQMFDENIKQTDFIKNLEIQKVFIENSDTQFTDIQLRTKDLASNEDLTENSDITTKHQIRNDSLTQNTDSEDDGDDNQKDVIPFKVLEEFNKVKVFLNKTDRCMSTDGYTTDSGYRSSDSQSRSSYKSALQLSGNWLNQSAHCIYSFIIECPLVANTEEICNEISLVLGKLVDKLHDEEMYPSFIEELFETINCFLQDLHEGENDCDSMLQKKDENIRRLLLLNRSRHLLNYTIEKIIQIFQDIHRSVTTEESYEIDNIAKIENLSYVFFVLEKLIQRHFRIKNSENTYSQNTQNTQSQNEECSLKRSSLTEIWKKKWNPNLNCSKKMDVCMENDCMVILGEVLNKLIVDCMDGYSLIAFAALQCFNMLQN